MNGKVVPNNKNKKENPKPTELRNGASLQFGNDGGVHHIVRCESSGATHRVRTLLDPISMQACLWSFQISCSSGTEMQNDTAV